MKCDQCQKEISNLIGKNWAMTEWMKLMNYFEHELTEGEITNATYESLTNSLMSLRPDDQPPGKRTTKHA